VHCPAAAALLLLIRCPTLHLLCLLLLPLLRRMHRPTPLWESC
jgi:hypothetical protein